MPSHQNTDPSPARGSPALREMEPKDQQLMVALRIRPLNSTELEEGATVIAHKVGDQKESTARLCEMDMSLLVTSKISEVVYETMLRQGVYLRTNNPKYR
ncbi:Kinesin-like protein KIF19 [Lemmus lemmus]